MNGMRRRTGTSKWGTTNQSNALLKELRGVHVTRTRVTFASFRKKAFSNISCIKVQWSWPWLAMKTSWLCSITQDYLYMNFSSWITRSSIVAWANSHLPWTKVKGHTRFSLKDNAQSRNTPHWSGLASAKRACSWPWAQMVSFLASTSGTNNGFLCLT